MRRSVRSSRVALGSVLQRASFRGVGPARAPAGTEGVGDDPLFGPASGAELPRYLADVASRLVAAEATFDKTTFTLGSDRDVTEGVLELQHDGERVAVPVGVVAVRRPAREIAIRLYFDAPRLGGSRVLRAPLDAAAVDATVPPAVAAHLRAMREGDIDGLVASFEVGGRVEGFAWECLHQRCVPQRDTPDYLREEFQVGAPPESRGSGGGADDGASARSNTRSSTPGSAGTESRPGRL